MSQRKWLDLSSYDLHLFQPEPTIINIEFLDTPRANAEYQAEIQSLVMDRVTTAKAISKGDKLTISLPLDAVRVLPELFPDSLIRVMDTESTKSPLPASIADTSEIDSDEGDISTVKHVDVGRKIGGAAKDRFVYASKYSGKSVTGVDLNENEALIELSNMAVKSVIWPAVNWRELKEKGVKPHVAALIKVIKDSISAKPTVHWARHTTDSEKARDMLTYIAQVSEIRESLMGLKSGDDITAIEGKAFRLTAVRARDQNGVSYDNDNALWSELNNAVPIASLSRQFEAEINGETVILQPAIDKSDRWYSSERVSLLGKRFAKPYTHFPSAFVTAQRKAFLLLNKAEKQHNDAWAALIPPKKDKDEIDPDAPKKLIKPKLSPHLKHVTRKGTDWRQNKDMTGEDILEVFGFSGVEYGNTMPNKERQEVLNFTYDSLMDLSQVVGIPPKALSLNGELAIAFGSRGRGGVRAASAHYEPTKKVINLTRVKGAGSLAHEWFHAFDHYASQLLSQMDQNSGVNDTPFLTDITQSHQGMLGRLSSNDPGIHSLLVDTDQLVNAMYKRSPTIDELSKRSTSEVKSLSHLHSWINHAISEVISDASPGYSYVNSSNMTVEDKLDHHAQSLVRVAMIRATPNREELNDIITHYAVHSENESTYLFDAVTAGLDEALKQINTSLESGSLGRDNELLNDLRKKISGFYSQHDDLPSLDADQADSRAITALTAANRRFTAAKSGLPERDDRNAIIKTFGKKTVSQISLSQSSLAREAEFRADFLAASDTEKAEILKQARKVDSIYYTNAVAIDGGKKKETLYWQSTIEMAARGFQAFVYDSLQSAGQHNDHLCHSASSDTFSDKTTYLGNPYPSGEERTAINEGFNNVMTSFSQIIANAAEKTKNEQEEESNDYSPR